MLFVSIKTVPTGYIGIKTHNGKVNNSSLLKEGLHFVLPFITSVKKIDTRLTKLELKVGAFAKDLYTVNLTISTQYSLPESEILFLYSQIGNKKDIEETLLQPIIKGRARNIITKYKTEELIKSRSQIQKKITQSIKEELTKILTEKTLNENALKIHNVEITDFDPSDEFKQLVKAKIKSEQQIIEAKTKAKIKKISAIASANAIIEEAKAKAEKTEISAIASANAIIEEAKAKAEKTEISAIASANAIIEEAKAKAEKTELESLAKAQSIKKQTKAVLIPISEFLSDTQNFFASLMILWVYKPLRWISKKLFRGKK